MIVRSAAIVGLPALLALLAAAASPQSGAYSSAQASRGKRIYDVKCASCHGGTLAGSDQAPPLAGNMFMGAWRGQSAADLAHRIQTTMPAEEPGTLGRAAVADIMAYMFAANRLPAGKADLPGDPPRLRQIRIGAGRP